VRQRLRESVWHVNGEGLAFWQSLAPYVFHSIGRRTTITAIVGYARTSTLHQVAGFEAQLRELTAAGCTKLFKEQVSSIAKRHQLEACLDYLMEGDTLIVTKLDRLARNVTDLGQLVATLKDKSVSLRILDLGLDTSSPTGELILNMMGFVAQFERQMMLERHCQGQG
jgi:DNA invertase Pin-like site-specific DNA recombinase